MRFFIHNCDLHRFSVGLSRGFIEFLPDVADWRRRLLSFISCFAGGVFLATCLLDLLPDYLQGINDAFSSAGVTVGSHIS